MIPQETYFEALGRISAECRKVGSAAGALLFLLEGWDGMDNDAKKEVVKRAYRVLEGEDIYHVEKNYRMDK